MKIIVTHASPDVDAITSVWLIRRFLSGWEEAEVRFVPAGERIRNYESGIREVIEHIGEDEVIHVDTGLGPLDHHETSDDTVSAASRTFDFVKDHIAQDKQQAVERIVRVVVAIDHFKEVFWGDPMADYHEFSLVSILDGLKLHKRDADDYYVTFVMECLDAILCVFENRLWAQREIQENGKEFTTRWGKGIGFETVNDAVLKLAQKQGFVVVVRKDPRKGYVRVKARPDEVQSAKLKVKSEGVDLTLAYEKLKKIDPDATWFLHVSKKMLLNGSVKNPKMRPTRLSLDDIVKVLETV